MPILNLDVLSVYSAMARHAAESQKVSATNIAHANDPGYKATHVEAFQDFLARAATNGSVDADNPAFKTFETDFANSPNGNSVNLELEMFRAADAQSQHEMALSVYTKSLDLLRTAIGKKG
ncbi:MAG: flagellar biosynthesis protein FlgB [Hyphomonas sp.]|nr:flagellar biosynthesis protein FlgB [Hyphomonas sp.]